MYLSMQKNQEIVYDEYTIPVPRQKGLRRRSQDSAIQKELPV